MQRSNINFERFFVRSIFNNHKIILKRCKASSRGVQHLSYLDSFPVTIRWNRPGRHTLCRSFATIKCHQYLGQKVSDLNPTMDRLDEGSFQSVISKFKRLQKNSNSENIDAVMKNANQLVEIFLNLATVPNMKEIMVENMNTLLNFFDLLERESEFDQLEEKMNSLCFANEATCFLVIRHQMKTKSWRDGLKQIEIMKRKGIEVHARTYHYIILNAIRSGDLTDALIIMKEMKTLEIVFHDGFYKLLLDTALSKGKPNFVFEILDLLKDTGFVLGTKSFGSIKSFFEKGICKCCGSELKKFSLPELQRDTLKEKLKNIAENAILDANGSTESSKLPLFTASTQNNPVSKMHALKSYIENNGPFDIALDVLNVAYFRDRGFNSFQVKRVVRNFNNMGKRILALCSSPLLSTLLEADTSPNLPNYHMIQLIHYLRRQKCGIFFVDDTKEDGHIDDFFIILTMVYHNLDIDIITADKFGDHIHSLDPTTRHHFQRWMRSHQIVLKKFTDTGHPLFVRRENFDIDVQSTKTSWHIPGPNKQWLCCTRR